jgi:hypothetical protein
VAKRRSPSGGSGSGSPGSGSRLRRGGSRVRSWLPSSSSYAAAEGVTLAAIVTYDVIGSTETKMPRPGPIVATMGFYAALAAAGSVSRSFEPVAVAVGWVLALSVLVTGNRGKGLLGLFSKLAGYVQNVGSSPAVG